jgi:hypothetical protein
LTIEIVPILETLNTVSPAEFVVGDHRMMVSSLHGTSRGNHVRAAKSSLRAWIGVGGELDRLRPCDGEIRVYVE